MAIEKINVKKMMIVVGLIVVLAGLSGCQEASSQRTSEYDRISKQIEIEKADALKNIAADQNNIRVVIDVLKVDSSEKKGLEAIFKYVDKNVAVYKSPTVAKNANLTIGLATGPFQAQLNIIKQNLKSASEQQIFIVLADRTTGYISIGKEIAVPRFYYFGRWYNRVDYQFQKAGKSLEVTAAKLPNGSIKLTLLPVFSKFLNDGGALELVELATTVIVRPGEKMVIGSDGSTGQDVATALFGSVEHNHRKQMMMIVTAFLH